MTLPPSALSARQIGAYGLLGLPLAFAALPIYMHVPRFYADTVGLDLALLGGVLLAARLLDAFIDPWLGSVADRMPRQRMLVLGLIPLMLGFVALFHPPVSWAMTWNLAWLVGALALTYLGFSAASIAYQAWGADLGADARNRTRLTGAREALGLVGLILAAALPSLAAENPGEGMARLSAWVPPVMLVALMVVFAVHGTSSASSIAVESPGRELRTALRDRAFVRLLLLFALNGIASALPATLFLFFVADVLQAEAWSGALLGLYFIAGAISVPAWVRLAASSGRALGWLAGMALALVAFASAGALGSGDVVAFALICLLSGLALGADVTFPAAIAADLGERQGRAGAYFGLWNFTAKLNLALAAGIALPLVGLMGYQPGGEDGRAALVLAYAFLPLVFKTLAIVLLWRWRHVLEN